MTIQEFYNEIDGDYEAILERLGEDDIILMILKKYINETDFEKLEESVQNGNIADSFMYAHNLKGVVGNLSLTKLYDKCCALVEQLRPKKEPADPKLFLELKEEYEKTKEALLKL